MSKFNERGLIQLLVPIILLIGIVGGVYLVQQTQIFKPKAGGGNVTRIEFVDASGNPITTTDTRNVKVKLTYVPPQIASPSPTPTPPPPGECTLAQFGAAYGSIVGEPDFNPNCDVNGDGRINTFDFIVLFRRPSPSPTSIPYGYPTPEYPTPGYVTPSYVTPSTPTPSPSSIPGPTITASPNPVPVGPGLGKTTISWNTGSSSSGEVWVSMDGANETFFAGGTSGSLDANWIWPGHIYTFKLYKNQKSTNPPMAEVTVMEGVSVQGVSTANTEELQGVGVFLSPTHFRLANSSYDELAQAEEQVFDMNGKIVDWELTERAGTKVVYAQFKVNGVWGAEDPIYEGTLAVKAYIEYKPTQSPTPSPSPQPNQVPTGTHDDNLSGADCYALGWAYDPDTSSESIKVQIYLDGKFGEGGTFAGEYVASEVRDDVNSTLNTTGLHGFRVRLNSAAGSPGATVEHQVYVYAIDSSGTPGANVLVNNTPKSIKCTPGPRRG